MSKYNVFTVYLAALVVLAIPGEIGYAYLSRHMESSTLSRCSYLISSYLPLLLRTCGDQIERGREEAEETTIELEPVVPVALQLAMVETATVIHELAEAQGFSNGVSRGEEETLGVAMRVLEGWRRWR
jgi:hypothetical protein